MIDTTIKYNYKDLQIVPASISTISSRSECNPFENDMLPIFTAPMSTVVNEQNIDIWKKNHITPIIPRNIARATREIMTYIGDNWVAHSLYEFKDLFCQDNHNLEKSKTYRVCVDLANGHMKSLYEYINKAKELSRKYGYTLEIMTGNIANPETYKWICEHAEVDYVRCSIGSGAGCTTASNTGIHYPIASLIDECYQIKRKIEYGEGKYREFVSYESEEYAEYEDEIEDPYIYYKSRPNIIADGGIRNYDDVVKALALGADYVMIGSLLASLFESAAPLNIECYKSHYKYMFNSETGQIHDGIKWYDWSVWTNHYDKVLYTPGQWEKLKHDFIHDMKEITKEFYGMSTKKAQKLIAPDATLKTSEGCTKIMKVTHTVKQWSENMIDFLKSTMSYTDSRTLQEFIGRQRLVYSPTISTVINK